MRIDTASRHGNAKAQIMLLKVPTNVRIVSPSIIGGILWQRAGPLIILQDAHFRYRTLSAPFRIAPLIWKIPKPFAPLIAVLGRSQLVWNMELLYTPS